MLLGVMEVASARLRLGALDGRAAYGELCGRIGVVREGDRGNVMYIVVSGRAAVWRGAHVTGHCDEGDYFGEIALLRDDPRNATVRAATRLDLLVLARDPFLEAVTGHPRSLSRASARVATRRLDDGSRALADQPDPAISGSSLN